MLEHPLERPASLESLLSPLDTHYTPRQKMRGFLRECRHNIFFETFCILCCEAGEFIGEAVAYRSSLPFVNELGLLTGFAAGGTYATAHIYRHGKQHSKHASILDAVKYAAATESACVISATSVEYLAGKISPVPQNPFDPATLELKSIAFPIAFLLGLGAMSALTFLKKDEAGRFVAQRDVLPAVNGFVHDHLHRRHTSLRGQRILLNGRYASLTVTEDQLPKSYWGEYNPETQSLYRIRSPVCRYDAGTKFALRSAAHVLFKKKNIEPFEVHDLFQHHH